MEIERPRRREPLEKPKNKAAPDKPSVTRREKSASVERTMTERPRRSGSADTTILALERKAHSLAKQRIQMELHNRRMADKSELKQKSEMKKGSFTNIAQIKYSLDTGVNFFCLYRIQFFKSPQG